MLAITVAIAAFRSASSARAQDGGSPDALVTIRVVVDATGRADVSESMRAGSDTTSHHAHFQLLARPCAAVGDVSVSSATRNVPLVRTSNDPWQLLEDTAGSPADRREATLRYGVTLSSGWRDIPLVVPARPVARGADGRSPGVTVSVVLPGAEDRVTFPRLLRTGTPGEWRGDFVAVPSFVSVEVAGTRGACTDERRPSSDGGLSWRFWLLVAILVVWVPTYQWWARRQPEGAR